MGSSGGSNWTIQSTSGISRPRAATSVHNKAPELALQNSKNVVVRFCCFCFPYRNKRKCPKIGEGCWFAHRTYCFLTLPSLSWFRKFPTIFVMQTFKLFLFDCLVFQMRFIKELKQILNKQCDSIRSKLFGYIAFN